MTSTSPPTLISRQLDSFWVYAATKSYSVSFIPYCVAREQHVLGIWTRRSQALHSGHQILQASTNAGALRLRASRSASLEQLSFELGGVLCLPHEAKDEISAEKPHANIASRLAPMSVCYDPDATHIHPAGLSARPLAPTATTESATTKSASAKPAPTKPASSAYFPSRGYFRLSRTSPQSLQIRRSAHSDR